MKFNLLIMERYRKGCISMLLSALLLISCGKDEYDFKEEGEVCFALSAEYVTSAVKSYSEGDFSIDDFTLEIFNEEGVKIKRWKYGEIKNESVRLNAGYKKAVAFYGDSLAAGFDVIYFAGESEFTVAGQSTTPVSITCRQSNVEIAVEWGEYIRRDYSDFTLRMRRDGAKGELLFGKEEKRSGYIPAGELEMEITLTDNGGKSRTYSPQPLQAAPNDFIKLTIDTKEPDLEQTELSIEIDRTTVDFTEEITIPAILVAKAAPSFTFRGAAEQSSASVSAVEGTTPEESLKLEISAPGYVRSCELVSEVTMPSGVEWPASIDLLGAETEKLAVLKEQGLAWDFSDGRNAYVDFSALVKNLRIDGAGGTGKMTLKVTDGKGKEESFVLDFAIAEADVSLAEVHDYDMWAKKAYVTVSTETGDASNLSVEMSADGGLNWTTPKMNEVSSDASSKRFEITGLAPETSYNFRGAYLSTRSADAAGTTEAAAQVPNSGFEEWSEWEYRVYNAVISSNDVYQTNYGPYASSDSKWWDCNNSETTPEDRTISNYTYKSFPMVTYVPGNGSSRAAQIMTIAISNYAISSTAPFPTVCAGRLFSGDYGGQNSRPFASRPSAISFDYKYVQHESDKFKVNVTVWSSGTAIGTGTLEEAASSGWETANVEIVYSDTAKTATDISVEFSSSSAGGTPPWKYNQSITYGGDKTASVHGGSILTVDNLEMVY